MNKVHLITILYDLGQNGQTTSYGERTIPYTLIEKDKSQLMLDIFNQFSQIGGAGDTEEVKRMKDN